MGRLSIAVSLYGFAAVQDHTLSTFWFQTEIAMAIEAQAAAETSSLGGGDTSTGKQSHGVKACLQRFNIQGLERCGPAVRKRVTAR